MAKNGENKVLKSTTETTLKNLANRYKSLIYM